MSNTITAYFKGRVGVAESVYQNDYGIVMAFDSIDLPAHFDCYFSRLNQEEALPGLGADNRVTIPNSILANPGNVTIHIPLHTGENDSEVEYVVYFKVIGRARPIDDGTPTQMTAIEQALALLQNPITNIEQIVNEALAFTGETFDEMQEDLDEWKTDTEEGLETWKGGVESDFNTLQAQFDTAVGAVTTDTEVTDIRVGADGVTDATAGASVRRQFTNLKAELKKTDLESTAFLPRHSGMMNYAGTSWMYTDNSNYQHLAIPVNAGDEVYITASGTGVYWAFLQSYSTLSAPVLSSAISSRQNNDYDGIVPSDTTYLYVNVKNNGTETIPTHLVINGWDYSESAKSQLLKDTETKYLSVVRNTPLDIINNNDIAVSKTSFTSGTVNVGFEEPDITTLGGSYSSGAQRITTLNGSLKANTKYTFFVKNTDGLIPAVGLADSNGYITYNSEKVETADWNKPFIFQTGASALTGVYAYLRGGAATLNNKLSIYVIEGEKSVDDFYIYDKKYTESRLFGKKVAWYGDSITQGYGWCSAINSLFDFVGTNCGSGGSRISYTSNRDDSMCLATRMQGSYTPSSGVATAIPNDVEVIFVEGGTNDWGNSVAVGDVIWTENPDNTVYTEACHLMFDNLTTLFPNAEIIVLGSPWAKWANHFTDTYGILNNIGLQTIDYGDALLDVAGRWGIKGINMSRLIAFNDNNIASLTSDGIHPNTNGAKVIADVVANYLLSL